MSDQAPASLRARLAQPQEVITKQSTLTRAADAMHRIDRLAEAMEKAADELERQLATIKGKL
jgi:predicted transcriptional regulator